MPAAALNRSQPMKTVEDILAGELNALSDRVSILASAIGGELNECVSTAELRARFGLPAEYSEAASRRRQRDLRAMLGQHRTPPSEEFSNPADQPCGQPAHTDPQDSAPGRDEDGLHQ
jgi:hypothetical protein